MPASPAVDRTRKITVVVISNTPPQVGELLMALVVGGRWVAESSASAPRFPALLVISRSGA